MSENKFMGIRSFSVAGRISENTAIDKEDLSFIDRKLKEMSQAAFIRKCINTQRKFEEGKLVEKENTKTKIDDERLGEVFEEKLMNLIDKGYLSVNKNNSAPSKKSDDLETKNEDPEEEKWGGDEDFMELLDSINDPTD